MNPKLRLIPGNLMELTILVIRGGGARSIKVLFLYIWSSLFYTNDC